MSSKITCRDLKCSCSSVCVFVGEGEGGGGEEGKWRGGREGAGGEGGIFEDSNCDLDY